MRASGFSSEMVRHGLRKAAADSAFYAFEAPIGPHFQAPILGSWRA